MASSNWEEKLKSFQLLGGLNALELWPTNNFVMIGWALLIFLPFVPCTLWEQKDAVLASSVVMSWLVYIPRRLLVRQIDPYE